MPSDRFFASGVSHAISDAAFRAFILIAHCCDASGKTPVMSIGRVNADFCGVVGIGCTDITPPIAELISVGLIRLDESAGGVWFIVDPSMRDMDSEA